ncbi:uncharacterized protein MONBRDRAFT_36461 [Monosiga brevicollis MX1]|uniref:FERM domain-containing protein n=1 Tax=Monosiga brevicollis TaxID=81824 RepID=A9UUN2_MONBE|nr:uncharacterized protein MONBRDRAFT_36461 [Monosiga brevicollis MX1]EDQ90931.1 predicted protein [Monosiga brevicollis MX1]|eukprot:XP_001744228.1 hypothetical protein [Monosiga brevicollis MX1]
MADRTCRVLMLDDSIRNFPASSSITGAELFQMVVSQYALHEKDYFGLCFDHPERPGLSMWLELDRTVKEQVKSRTFPQLTFTVRYYPSDIRIVKELSTQRLLFRHALRLLSSGNLACPTDQAMTLAALALQTIEGDFIDVSATRHHLDNRKLIADEVLVAQGSSLELCTQQVSAIYKTLIGMENTSAMLSFMTIVQTLPQYGIHYFKVQDKKGMPWLLGINQQGIRQYYYSDPAEPRRMLPWGSIVNLSYVKNRFHVGVDFSADPDRLSQSEASRNGGSKTDSPDASTRASAISPFSNSSSTGDQSRPAARPRSRIFSLNSSKKRAGSSDGSHEVWITDSVDHAKVLMEWAADQHRYHLAYRNEVAVGNSMRRRHSARASIFASGDQTALPAQRRIRLPSNKQVQEMMLAIDPHSKPVLTEAIEEMVEEGSHAELERLQKRRRQLAAELERKLALLQKLEIEERDWISSVQGQPTASRRLSVAQQAENIPLDQGERSESPEVLPLQQEHITPYLSPSPLERTNTNISDISIGLEAARLQESDGNSDEVEMTFLRRPSTPTGNDPVSAPEHGSNELVDATQTTTAPNLRPGDESNEPVVLVPRSSRTSLGDRSQMTVLQPSKVSPIKRAHVEVSLVSSTNEQGVATPDASPAPSTTDGLDTSFISKDSTVSVV